MRPSFSSTKFRRRRKFQVELLEARQLLTTLTVTTTADPTSPGAALSLREAIEIADATPDNYIIDFNIPTKDPGYDPATGVWTITPHSALPALTGLDYETVINGYSQPGASENTLSVGDNAKLAIAINGAGLGTVNGLTMDQQLAEVSGLDIENFGGAGVLVMEGNSVTGCFIGTDPKGETAAPNGNGVVVEGLGFNIGGTFENARNVISGNSGPGAGYGIYIPDPTHTTTSVDVQNNYIGLDASGTKALGNSAAGVADFGSDDIYGDPELNITPNVISGNGGDGLESTGNIAIEACTVGLDAAGNAALGNGGSGITNVGAGNAAINTTILGNFVSGNAQSGISISPGSPSQSTYTIEANFIGTNRAGSMVIGNGSAGLELDGVENAAVIGNVMSGNKIGLSLSGSGTDVEHNVIEANWIGTDRSGLIELPNTTYGVSLSSAIGNLIGKGGGYHGNEIAFNGGDAIHVSGGQQNQITQNSIDGNAGAGIKFSGNGTNQSVTPPVMTFTPGTGITGTLSGTLASAPNTAYVVEIYSNRSVPVAGHEQGQTFLQDVTVDTDKSGKGSFSVSEPSGVYTATSTDPGGNTSEFSGAVGFLALPASTTTVSSSLNPSTLGQKVTFTAIVAAPGFEGEGTDTVTFTIDGQAQTPVPVEEMVNIGYGALFVTSTLTAGQHTVTAAFSGDVNYSPSTGSPLTQTVSSPNAKSTTTTLISSLNPSTYGQMVSFTAVVSPGASSGTPTGTVSFTIDGTTQAPVALQKVGGVEEAVFFTATLGTGEHTVSATYNGDATFAPSVVSSRLVQTVNPGSQGGGTPAEDGPTVVSLERFGIHMQPTVLVLTFNDGLDPTWAPDLANYKIVGPDGRTVAISSATFDEALNTVMLRPKTRINLHHTYKLTVIGTGAHGVRDTQGLLLDGANNGRPGSNYTGSLTWRNVVWAPGELNKNGQPKPYKPAGRVHHRFPSRSH